MCRVAYTVLLIRIGDPFSRAHEQEASGVLSGTMFSPKVCWKGCEKGTEKIAVYTAKQNHASMYYLLTCWTPCHYILG